MLNINKLVLLLLIFTLASPVQANDEIPTNIEKLSNYYEILGVSQNASEEEIIKAARRLVSRYHTDRNPSPEAKEITAKVIEAREILTDPQKRAEYDASISGQLTPSHFNRTAKPFHDIIQRPYYQTHQNTAAAHSTGTTVVNPMNTLVDVGEAEGLIKFNYNSNSNHLAGIGEKTSSEPLSSTLTGKFFFLNHAGEQVLLFQNSKGQLFTWFHYSNLMYRLETNPEGPPPSSLNQLWKKYKQNLERTIENAYRLVRPHQDRPISLSRFISQQIPLHTPYSNAPSFIEFHADFLKYTFETTIEETGWTRTKTVFDKRKNTIIESVETTYTTLTPSSENGFLNNQLTKVRSILEKDGVRVVTTRSTLDSKGQEVPLGEPQTRHIQGEGIIIIKTAEKSSRTAQTETSETQSQGKKTLSFQELRNILKNSPGRLYQSFQKLHQHISEKNKFSPKTPKTETISEENRQTFSRWSPRRVQEMTLQDIHTLFSGASTPQPKGTFRGIRNRFALETLAFYTAQGAIMQGSSSLESYLHGAPGEISPVNSTFDIATSPLGLFSFFSFIVASGYTNAGVLKLRNLMDTIHNKYAMKINSQAKAVNGANTAQLRNLRRIQSILNPLHSMLKFSAMPAGLAAGMTVSTVVHEWWADPNRKACINGLKKKENLVHKMPLSSAASLLTTSGAIQEIDYKFIDSCEQYYRDWTLSSKYREYKADVISLIAAAYIANKAITPFLQFILTSSSKKVLERMKNSQKTWLTWIKKQAEKLKSNPNKESGRIIAKLKKWGLTFGKQLLNFIPFLWTAEQLHGWTISMDLKNLGSDIVDQRKNLEDHFQQINLDEIDRLPQEECILKEKPNKMSQADVWEYIRDGYDSSGEDTPIFTYIGKLLFNDTPKNCLGRQNSSFIKDYSANMTEWRQTALQQFMMKHQSWFLNTQETLMSYELAKNFAFTIYNEKNKESSEEEAPESHTSDLEKSFFGKKISPLEPRPFFGIGLIKTINPLLIELELSLDEADRIPPDTLLAYLQRHNPSWDDIQPFLKKVQEHLRDIEPIDSATITQVLSSYPDEYLNFNYYIPARINLRVIKTLFSCSPGVSDCEKHISAGVQLVNKTFSVIDNKRGRNRSTSSRNLRQSLLEIKNLLVCGKEDSCSISEHLNVYSKGTFLVKQSHDQYTDLIQSMREQRESWFPSMLDSYSEHPVKDFIQKMACGSGLSSYQPVLLDAESQAPLDIAKISDVESIIDQLPLFTEPAVLGAPYFTMPRITKEKAPDSICNKPAPQAFNQRFSVHGNSYANLLLYVLDNIDLQKMEDWWIEKIEFQMNVIILVLKNKYRHIVSSNYIPSILDDGQLKYLDVGAGGIPIVPEDSEELIGGFLEETANTVDYVFHPITGRQLLDFTGVLTANKQQVISKGVFSAFTEQASFLLNTLDRMHTKDQSKIVEIHLYDDIGYNLCRTPEFEQVAISTNERSTATQRGLFTKRCEGSRSDDDEYLDYPLTYILASKAQILQIIREELISLIEDIKKYNTEHLSKIDPSILTTEREILIQQEDEKNAKLEEFQDRFKDISVLFRHLIDKNTSVQMADYLLQYGHRPVEFLEQGINEIFKSNPKEFVVEISSAEQRVKGIIMSDLDSFTSYVITSPSIRSTQRTLNYQPQFLEQWKDEPLDKDKLTIIQGFIAPPFTAAAPKNIRPKNNNTFDPIRENNSDELLSELMIKQSPPVDEIEYGSMTFHDYIRSLIPSHLQTETSSVPLLNAFIKYILTQNDFEEAKSFIRSNRNEFTSQFEESSVIQTAVKKYGFKDTEHFINVFISGQLLDHIDQWIRTKIRERSYRISSILKEIEESRVSSISDYILNQAGLLKKHILDELAKKLWSSVISSQDQDSQLQINSPTISDVYMLMKYNAKVRGFILDLKWMYTNNCTLIMSIYSPTAPNYCNRTLFTPKEQTTMSIIQSLQSLFLEIIQLNTQVDTFSAVIHREKKKDEQTAESL